MIQIPSQTAKPICSKREKKRSYSPEEMEEMKRCKQSPVYFYNKYFRKEGQKEMTEEEYSNHVTMIEHMRSMPLKLRSQYKDGPVFPSECFKK